MRAARSSQQSLVPLQLRARGDPSPKNGLIELVEKCLRVCTPSLQLALVERLLRHTRGLGCGRADITMSRRSRRRDFCVAGFGLGLDD